MLSITNLCFKSGVMYVSRLCMSTDNQGFSAWTGQARESLSKEGGDLQQQLACCHLQGKWAATFGRIHSVYSKIHTHAHEKRACDNDTIGCAHE